MSTTRNGNTSFQSTKLLEICLKYGKRYLLDNYNNDETPADCMIRRGFAVALPILCSFYIKFSLFLFFVFIFGNTPL